MGCDIHLFIEYLHNDAVLAWADGEISIDRDYRLFAALAGVRSAEPPEIPPRGLPTDVSWHVFDHYYLLVQENANALVHRWFNFATPTEAASYVASGKSHAPPPGQFQDDVT